MKKEGERLADLAAFYRALGLEADTTYLADRIASAMTASGPDLIGMVRRGVGKTTRALAEAIRLWVMEEPLIESSVLARVEVIVLRRDLTSTYTRLNDLFEAFQANVDLSDASLAIVYLPSQYGLRIKRAGEWYTRSIQVVALEDILQAGYRQPNTRYVADINPAAFVLGEG